MNKLSSTLSVAFALLLVGPVAAQTGVSLPVVLAPGTVAHGPHSGPGRGGGVPVNDDCATVPDMVLPLGGSVTFTGDNTGATATNDFEPGSILEGVGPCVWHKFTTAGCANITVS